MSEKDKAAKADDSLGTNHFVVSPFFMARRGLG